MLQRAVLITEGTTVSQIFVENVPSELTVTAADKVLGCCEPQMYQCNTPIPTGM